MRDRSESAHWPACTSRGGRWEGGWESTVGSESTTCKVYTTFDQHMEEAVGHRDPRWSRSVCMCVCPPPTLQRLDPCLSCSSGLNSIHSWDGRCPRYCHCSLLFYVFFCMLGCVQFIIVLGNLWNHGPQLKRLLYMSNYHKLEAACVSVVLIWSC